MLWRVTTQHNTTQGYSEEQIVQMWGGNLLRVMDRCAEIAQEIQAEQAAEVTK